jgi:NTE family protein
MSTPPARNDLALVLTGGGARAAYQAGVLLEIAERFPALETPILTGVSAGAVNIAHLAAHSDSFAVATADLARFWAELTTEQVFHADSLSLARNAVRWGARLVSGGVPGAPRVESLVDTQPLREFLEEALGAKGEEPIPGIADKLRRGVLKAVAVITTSYSTGQTIVWVQGKDIQGWSRPQRRGVRARLTVEHVMASTALPLFFPAVQIGGAWYGDGGVRLTAPLSPALHLGASRILAISTRYEPTAAEAERPRIRDYPPPAQVLGILMNAIFLDLIDQDAHRFELVNRILERVPEASRGDLRLVDLLVIRPSQDLGQLVKEFEPSLPRAFRFMTRGLGTRETTSPDLLSMLSFQPDYIQQLIEIGRADVRARAGEIAAFLAPPQPERVTPPCAAPPP